MSSYAILIVPSEWEPDQAPGLSAAGRQQWLDQMPISTRVLIYKSEPVNAIVAEGEYVGLIENIAEWPDRNVSEQPTAGANATGQHVMPLRILYTRDRSQYVSLERIREYVPDFSPGQTEWQPIATEAYQELADWPGPELP